VESVYSHKKTREAEAKPPSKLPVLISVMVVLSLSCRGES
jgi:hypothetical protein